MIRFGAEQAVCSRRSEQRSTEAPCSCETYDTTLWCWHLKM